MRSPLGGSPVPENITDALAELEFAILDFLKLPNAKFALALHWSAEANKLVIDSWFCNDPTKH
jgi:hypothetical protein